jgi:hypothetical protein
MDRLASRMYQCNNLQTAGCFAFQGIRYTPGGAGLRTRWDFDNLVSQLRSVIRAVSSWSWGPVETWMRLRARGDLGLCLIDAHLLYSFRIRRRLFSSENTQKIRCFFRDSLGPYFSFLLYSSCSRLDFQNGGHDAYNRL